MAKDYRKPASRKPAARRGMGLLPAVMLAFLTGYITANVFDAESLGHWLEQSLARIKQAAPEDKSRVHTPAKKPALPKPKFEFYTLLSQDTPGTAASHNPPKERQLPSVDSHTLARSIQKQVQVQSAKGLPPIQKKALQKRYDIQLASYIKRRDAERLQADLLLKDYDAYIQEFKRGDGHGFRVIIGPYASLREAEKAQVSVARSQHVMGIIRRQDA